MSISFLYRCDGCNNEATAGHVRRVFKSFSGRNHGFGVHHVDIGDGVYYPTCVAVTPGAEVSAGMVYRRRGER